MSVGDTNAPVEYREIQGHKKYRIGSDGSVWSWRRKAKFWRQLKPTANSRNGYLTVDLRRDGRGFRRYVHHLVLEAFVCGMPDGLECRHLDGNPSNNTVDNLCWGTKSENMFDCIRHGRWKKFGGVRPKPSHASINAGERNAGARISAEDVRVIRLRAGAGESAKSLSSEYGITDESIRRVVRRAKWKCID